MGIETIQTDEYDSDIHDVISVIDGGDKIIDVVSKGYSIKINHLGTQKLYWDENRTFSR